MGGHAFLITGEIIAMDEKARRELQGYLKHKKTNDNFVYEKNRNEIYSYIFKEYTRSFRDTLNFFINAKGVTAPYLYKKADLNRNVYSCIKKDQFHQVTKRTVICFALALELSPSEAEELLLSAGFAFNRSNPLDLIILYHIENKIYDIITINSVIHDLLGMVI